MCPRSGFRSGGTCERTLVPVVVPVEHLNVPLFRFSFRGNICQTPPFWKTTLLSTPDKKTARFTEGKRPYYRHFVVKYTGRGLVVKRPGVLSKVQMLNLVLGVGVFSLLRSTER